MVEIRTFDGAAEEMGGFIESVWKTAGGDTISTPLWSQEFFDWQFFQNPQMERDYLVAAYDGGRLVAAFMALDGRFRSRDRSFRGSLGSWLTVHPDYRSQFLALQLVATMKERHASRGSELVLGFGYPTDNHMSLEFWQAVARAWPDVVSIGSPLSTWIRVLEPQAVVRCGLTLMERLKARAVGVILPSVREQPKNARIRDALPDDAAGCLRLLEEAASGLDFAVVWDEPRLRHQLSFGTVARSLVALAGGEIVGWINFHYLDLSARERLPIAVIDHFIAGPKCDWPLRIALLRAALAEMRRDGACLATALQSPLWPAAALLRCGFIPQGLGHRPVLMSTGGGPPVEWTSKAYVLLR